MLKKENCVPGSLIRTTSVLKHGAGVFDGAGTMSNLPFMQAPGEIFTATLSSVAANEVLEIVSGPKRTNRINCLTVKKVNGTVGFVYWTNIRSSANHI